MVRERDVDRRLRGYRTFYVPQPAELSCTAQGPHYMTSVINTFGE